RGTTTDHLLSKFRPAKPRGRTSRSPRTLRSLREDQPQAGRIANRRSQRSPREDQQTRKSMRSPREYNQQEKSPGRARALGIAGGSGRGDPLRPAGGLLGVPAFLGLVVLGGLDQAA